MDRGREDLYYESEKDIIHDVISYSRDKLYNISCARTDKTSILNLNELERDKIYAIVQDMTAVTTRASVNFEVDLEENSISVMRNVKSPLEAGETVTINASYSPFSASVDFGLIAPDGYFYYINVKNGSINKTIRVDERGNYMLAVRNNSDDTVSVVGYVNY